MKGGRRERNVGSEGKEREIVKGGIGEGDSEGRERKGR